jgi:nodulation protein E
MTAALDDARLAPEAIDYVNAHGTGTRLNDKCEAAALLQCFGARLPRLPVSSTKSMLGHAMAAAGALEMIVTCLALARAVIPPTANFTAPDPECDVDCVPIEARRRAIGAAMSSSLAFGGLNAVLVAQRLQP